MNGKDLYLNMSRYVDKLLVMKSLTVKQKNVLDRFKC